MHYYYITGTSRGIGKAFAEHLLKDVQNTVTGIARQQTIEHPNYHHVTLDLTDISAVQQYRFELHGNAESITLINNAGALGFIKPVGTLESDTIIRNFSLNLISPAVLTNEFMNCFGTTDCRKVILNISSGAGKTPIDGWAVYCASKAGIDMFSRVVDAEQTIRKSHPQENIHRGFEIYSIAPGVVDTAMQEQIRAASQKNFSRLEDFIGYKENNELATAESVSLKYMEILSHPDSIKAVLSSIRDYK